MKKDDAYFDQLLRYAIAHEGSCRAVSVMLDAKRGANVQMWKNNGVAHWARMPMDEIYGKAFCELNKKE